MGVNQAMKKILGTAKARRRKRQRSRIQQRVSEAGARATVGVTTAVRVMKGPVETRRRERLHGETAKKNEKGGRSRKEIRVCTAGAGAVTVMKVTAKIKRRESTPGERVVTKAKPRKKATKEWSTLLTLVVQSPIALVVQFIAILIREGCCS